MSPSSNVLAKAGVKHVFRLVDEVAALLENRRVQSFHNDSVAICDLGNDEVKENDHHDSHLHDPNKPEEVILEGLKINRLFKLK